MNNLEELGKKPRFTHIILWMVLLLIIIGFIWAYFAKIDEVTTATGKVIPSSKVQIIQNLEDGIVKKILVHEGETVKQGQLLIELEDIRYASEYRANKLKRQALEARIARLNAEVTNTSFKVSAKLQKDAPNLVNTEKALYLSRQNEIKHLQQRQNLLQKEINMTRPLIKSGAVSEVEVLRLEQGLAEIEGKILAFRSEALKELSLSMDELNKLNEEANALKDRLERTSLHSPVHGIIKQIHVTTIGGVIKSGMPLIEIVPLEDTLLVEAQVNPKDIGFIHIGQPALVKITAYDYSIYGGLEGKVEHISADTSTDKEGNSYYEVWVRTKKAYLGSEKKKLQIIPGMQASVSILTGKKTVLDYLLKPILKAKEKALRER